MIYDKWVLDQVLKNAFIDAKN